EFIQNDLFDVPFDIGGWDIRKALQLLHKSNAVIFEWLNSPIVYHSDNQFLQAIQAVQNEFFDVKAIFYHYQGMAKNASGELELDKPIKLKKWFYLLRALLASIWTLEQAYPPPVDFNLMLPLLNKSYKQEI
ncbi:nucleotidyltransferase domain-containing protein, partial [Planococcus sp. MERTA32b]|nr:nucleotidyltransferase domain-containing protein [Planococcus sp. MER TA 32b]